MSIFKDIKFLVHVLRRLSISLHCTLLRWDYCKTLNFCTPWFSIFIMSANINTTSIFSIVITSIHLYYHCSLFFQFQTIHYSPPTIRNCGALSPCY